MNKNILIFSPSILPDRHFGTDLEIAKKHLAQGDNVSFILCDSSISYCEQNPEHLENICLNCMQKSMNALKNLIKIDSRNIYYISNTTNYTKLINFEDSIITDKENLRNLTYKGMDLGSSVLSTLVTILKDSNPNLTANKHLTLSMVNTGIIIYETIKYYLENIKPDIFYIFNGRTITRRPALRAAQELNLEVYVQEGAGEIDLYSLTKNTMPHDLIYMKKTIEDHWNTNHNYEEKYKLAEAWYNNRIRGLDQAWYSFTKEQIKNHMPEGFNPNKRNVAIFNSSEDEFESVDAIWKDTKFFNQNKVIREIMTHYIDNEDIQFYLRVHPNLSNTVNKQTREIESFDFKNLSVISAESKVDSYSLIDICDLIIIFSSTIGIEANFKNKPVILLGRATYEDLKYINKPDSYDELFHLINNINLIPKNNIASIIYGYWLATWGYKYEYYQPTGILSGNFEGKSLNDISLIPLEIVDIIDKYWYYKTIQVNEVKTSNLLVSFIITSYDQNLTNIINNILSLSYKNIEVIIISKDFKELEQYRSKIDFKEIILDSDSLSNAKNKAIDMALGEYIFFISGDAILFPHSIEILIKNSIASNSEMVYGNYIKYRNNQYIETNQINVSNFDSMDFLKKSINKILILRGTYLLKKSSIYELGKLDNETELYEEEDLINKFVLYKKCTKIEAPILLTYESNSNINNEIYHTSFYKILKKIGLKDFTRDLLQDNEYIVQYIDNIIRNSLLSDSINKNFIIELIEQVQQFNPLNSREQIKNNLIKENNNQYFENILEYNNVDFTYLQKIYKENIYRSIYLLDENNKVINTIIKSSIKFINFEVKGKYKRVVLFEPPFIIDHDFMNYHNFLVKDDFAKKKLLDQYISNLNIHTINEIDISSTYSKLENVNELDNKLNFLIDSDITLFNNVFELVESYIDIFKNNNKVRLIINYQIYEKDIIEKIKILINKNNSPEIILLNYKNDSNELISLYRNSDVFLAISSLYDSKIKIIRALESHLYIIANELQITQIKSEITFEDIYILKNESLNVNYQLLGSDSHNLVINKIDTSKLKYIMKLLNKQKFDLKLKKKKYITINNELQDNKKNKALIQFNSLLENINSEESTYEEALEFFNNKDFYQAEKTLNKIIAQSHNNNLYFDLGKSQFMQNKFNEALESFIKSLEISIIDNKVDYKICESIGDTLIKLNDNETAKIYYEKAKQIKENLETRS